MFPGWDLYDADPVKHLTMAGYDPDDLDHDPTCGLLGMSARTSVPSDRTKSAAVGDKTMGEWKTHAILRFVHGQV